jgi:polar amino acid transport system substrate-binding protein
MMTPKTGGITAFDQMKGKAFGSDTGSANESWLKSAEPTYGPFTEKSYNAWLDAVLDLQAGRLDGVVVDAPIAQYYIQQHPDSNLAMPLYIPNFSAGQALAFKKGSPIRDVYNQVQDAMVKDGTLKGIFVKWFGVQPLADSCTINVCAPYMPNEKPTPTK